MDRTGRDALIALRRVVKASEVSATDLSTRTRLTPSQAVVLQIIAREGQTDAGTLSGATRLTQGGITPILDRLEELGLVRRERDPSDRRRARLRLTNAGERVEEELSNALQGKFLDRFSQLDRWTQHGLVAALEFLATLLETGTKPERPPSLILPGPQKGRKSG